MALALANGASFFAFQTRNNYRKIATFLKTARFTFNITASNATYTLAQVAISIRLVFSVAITLECDHWGIPPDSRGGLLGYLPRNHSRPMTESRQVPEEEPLISANER